MRVGSVVKCIDADFSMYPNLYAVFQTLPKQGNKYTVREVRPKGAEGGLLLEEIENKDIYNSIFMGYLEPAFHPKRFIEVDELIESEKVKEHLAVTA